MNITPEMRYFAVARMTRQLEKMADNYDIHQLHDHRLSDMAEEIERIARLMRAYCIDRVGGLE